MNFLGPVPLPSPGSRQLHRELQLSVLAGLTGCALGVLLMITVSAGILLKPTPAARGRPTFILASDR